MTTTDSRLIRGHEVVIGIETHVQLATRSKAFSGASTAFGAEANTQACAVDLALPGTLPVMNRAAVECAIRFGLAVQAVVAPLSIFARKNYFYPDLPKGYQISQYEIPVVQGGTISYSVGKLQKQVRLTRAHLEEDAGKSLHEDFHGMSGIDLNRAGTPLLEIVTEPDLASAEEAVEYARTLHGLVTWLGICDGNLAEGSFRCDANVSVRRPGAPLGTRREIKNLNSFRFMREAIEFEINWQIDRIEDGLAIEQATVLFDPDSGETRMMRSKEDAHDYRYFPDPDLPPLAIDAAWVDRVRASMPELPAAMAQRFASDYRLPPYDAAMMTQSRTCAELFESASRQLLASVDGAGRVGGEDPREALPKLVANWLMGEYARRLNADAAGFAASRVDAPTLAALISRIVDGTISNSAARKVFERLWDEGESPAGRVDALIGELGLRQMDDADALGAIVDQVIAANPKSVDEYRSGKDKAFNALVGQVMKVSKGKANPGQVNDLLKLRLQA